ncbi:MAG: DNA replication/repair protein RecF [Anaerolineae bacterium]|nr:MAG: DNA replication/repair protein RecF [Anaerolineae bacterium]
MYLQHLSLINFRNYVRLDLDLPASTIVLQGANAQGKTNLLEAIYYLATSRSPHTTADRQLINWLADEEPLPHARLVAEIFKGETAYRIEVTLLKQASANGVRLQKEIRINGVPRRAMDLLGVVNAVLFRPQDMELADGPPSRRRHYLDATLCQVNRPYCETLRDYQQVIEQRNALLRSLRDRGRAAGDELFFWDEKLVASGARLVATRQATLAELERLAQPVHRTLSGGKETLRLRYAPSFDPSRDPDAAYQMALSLDAALGSGDFPMVAPSQVAEVFGTHLRQIQREEIARGMTLLGPHRDDFRLEANGVDLRTYGSRGQQRTAILSLKLAETQFMRQATGHQPILLLDEVMAELDRHRQQHLLKAVTSVQQAVLTTTEWDVFGEQFLTRSLRLSVREGRIQVV